MSSPSSPSGVYLLLDEQWASGLDLSRVMESAVECGIRLFQYRNKTDSMDAVVIKAKALCAVAARSGVVFIVNDRCDVALAVGADGVHLGQEDLPLDVARRIMGPDNVIGVSTHRPEDVTQATRGGADYIGFGPLFPTTTKEHHAPTVGLSGLRGIRSLTPLPVFAIGGITFESLHAVREAGANGVAVASAVLDSSEMERTMRDFVRQWHA